MWTCPQCARTFVNNHQWHSCVELTLDASLAAATDHAVGLYRQFEAATAACGDFRVHPQKTRIAFISTMTFATVRLARRWIDVSFIAPEPIDDPRVRTLECYGPTSFAHGLRIAEPEDLDDDVRAWLCVSLRRGDRDTLEPTAHVAPLLGRPLEIVVVPLRCVVIRPTTSLAVTIPRYAAEVFEAHPAVRAKVARQQVSGVVEAANGHWQVTLREGTLESLGIGLGETADVFLRANL